MADAKFGHLRASLPTEKVVAYGYPLDGSSEATHVILRF